ncbi:MAG TPA: flagellar biosynthetic protein FliR [Candidatus Dormibacteraeota bacterium]|nr:flagellar biosynthetic protein FliR [Candidatus Dormibacteraeota bacterium]
MVNFFGLTPAGFETFLLVFVRTAVTLSLIPVLGGPQFPLQAKVALAGTIAFLVFKTIHPIAPLPSLFALANAIAAQALIGLVIGYVAFLVFMAVQFGGEIIDLQIGFSIVNVVDPMSQQQVSVIGQFELIIASLIYLATDSHLLLIQGLAESFTTVPLPYVAFTGGMQQDLGVFLAQSFLLAIKIAAPVAAALFVTNLALGLMARVAPQINVFVVGFPLQIGVGLIMVAVTLPLLGYLLPQAFSALPQQVQTTLRTMRPAQ